MVAAYTAHDQARRGAEERKTAAVVAGTEEISRSNFARDRARVLHSASFRRLAGKTQVVTLDEEAIPRTRLTHSLEVAQIARDIGLHLGCDPDLVDLAGLAHDIGHPPFGHNGEAALNEIAADIGGFEANAQNLRLLTRLEPKIVGDGQQSYGVNLTRASLDAVIKYPWQADPQRQKFGVYDDDIPTFAWIREGGPGGEATCLESQVMDWADDVAYSVHDVEDGVAAGHIDLSRLQADRQERQQVAEAAARSYSSESAADLAQMLHSLLLLPAIRPRLHFERSLTGAASLKQLTSELTGRFVTGAIVATQQRYGYRPLCRYEAELVIPRQLAAEVAVLKAIAFHYVIAAPSHLAGKQRQQQLLRELVPAVLDRGADAFDPPFRELYVAADTDDRRLRVAIDQIALLTDRQAVGWYRRLVAPADTTVIIP